MRRFNKLMGIMSISLMTLIFAQDAAGDYKLNGVLVKHILI